MLKDFTENDIQELKALLSTKDSVAIGEFIRGAISERLRLENWLDVVFQRQEGTVFSAPLEAVGRKAKKIVRGEVLETFTVSKRTVMLSPELYASYPSIFVGDLERGDLVQAADLINLARQGIQDMILADAYKMVQDAAEFGDANFVTIVDDGTLSTDTGAPAYLPKIKRQLDLIMSRVEDSTTSRNVRGIIGRRVLLSDIPGNTGLTDIQRAQFELSPRILQDSYRGVPLLPLSGAKDDNGNIIFPENELYVIGDGAASYSIPRDVDVTARPQTNLIVGWELWTERIIAMWFPELIYRIYIINNTPGNVTSIKTADANEVNLVANKYVKKSSITATTIKVYLASGGDPGAGNPGTSFAANGVTVTPDGLNINLKFASALSAGTYNVYNTTGLQDIGSTGFNATSHASPIGSFTV